MSRFTIQYERPIPLVSYRYDLPYKSSLGFKSRILHTIQEENENPQLIGFKSRIIYTIVE